MEGSHSELRLRSRGAEPSKLSLHGVAKREYSTLEWIQSLSRRNLMPPCTRSSYKRHFKSEKKMNGLLISDPTLRTYIPCRASRENNSPEKYGAGSLGARVSRGPSSTERKGRGSPRTDRRGRGFSLCRGMYKSHSGV